VSAIGAPTVYSPLPWRVTGTAVVDPRGFVVSEVRPFLSELPGMDRDDAEFIVRACNAHNGLLKAARAAWHALQSYQHGNASPDLAAEVVAALDAAIAKAEGRS
jgi:hypothetical protein